MLTPEEALSQKLAAFIAFAGGAAGVVFAHLQDLMMTGGTALISVATLLMNWYFQRRRDQREQARFDRENDFE